MAHLRPPPKIDPCAWVEANVIVPGDVSATGGRMRLYPYQRGPLEALDDPDTWHVCWVKPVRVGATALMVATVANYVANDPCLILAIQPTQDDARDFIVSTLDPTFAASPALAGLISQDEKRRDTITSRRFPGGSLKCISPVARNLRRHTVRVLVCDELDAWEMTPEGPPYELALKRTLSFPNRKVFAASTPTDTETSQIQRLYEQSDQRIWEWSCASCGEYFEARWKHVRWDKDANGGHLPDTAHLVCPANGCIIEEKHKPAMLESGRWRATKPDVKGRAGFRCSAIISPLENARWAELVREFLKAKGDPDLMRVFSNTWLGEPFHHQGGEGLDDQALAKLVEPIGLQFIPDDVRIITAGVDVQGYGLEVVTLGHSATQMHVLAYETVHGPPTSDQTWRDLDALLQRASSIRWGAR